MNTFYLFIFMLCVTTLSAQKTFLEENFDYSQGDLIRNHGWNSHSSGGTNPIITSADGLAMAVSEYAGNGIGQAAWVINNGSDENKTFNEWVRQPNEGESSVSTYVSFLLQPYAEIPLAEGTARPYFLHLGEYNDIENPDPFDLSTAHRARTFIYPGTLPNTFKLNLSFNENEPDALNQTSNFSSDIVHLIVLKYTSIAGEENDEVSMYVFKDGDDTSVEPTTPTIGPLKGTNRDVVLQAVALRQFQDNQNVIVDGIIARDHWNMKDVSTSISEIQDDSKVQLFPNPNSGDQLFFKMEHNSPFDIQIRDINGRNIVQARNVVNQYTLPDLSEGMYLVSLQQDGNTYHRKLIIKN